MVRKQLYIFTFLLMFSVVGCSKSTPTGPNTTLDTYGYGYAAMLLQDAVVNRPPDQPKPGPGSPGALPEGLQAKATRSEPCCRDCICGDNCTCAYPGECLVKANNGWPVQKCNNGVCTVYYPRDDEGKPYDPYKVVRDNPTKYKDLQKMLPENNAQSASGGCSSCGSGSSGRRGLLGGGFF